MRARNQEHARFVTAWLDARVDGGSSASHLAALLLDAARAIWARSRTSLGDVTLSAIYGRVLETGQRDVPLLARLELRVGADFSLAMNLDVAARADPGELLAATRHLIIELLRVLGRLTGETLTSSLRAALSELPVGGQQPPVPKKKDKDRR